MSSQVQICNAALIRLGASTITSITENTAEAKLCNNIFTDLADDVMIEGSWTSTIRRASLARTSDTPAFEYTYSFQLPVDPFCLKVLNTNESVPGDVQHVIENDRLLTDNSTVKIRYIARLTDTTDWDPMLRKAFVARLTAELAYSLTGDARKAAQEFERYRLLVQESLAINNQQGSKQIISSLDLTEVR